MTAILREDPPELPRESGARSRRRSTASCAAVWRSDRTSASSRRAIWRSRCRSVLGSSTSSTHAVPVAAASSRCRSLVVAGALLLGGIGLFLAGRFTAARTAETAPRVVSFAQVTDLPGVEATPTLSPDGKSLVYAKIRGHRYRPVHAADRQQERRAADCRQSERATSQPAFSPDGERIAFRSGRDGGGIFLMTASGNR